MQRSKWNLSAVPQPACSIQSRDPTTISRHAARISTETARMFIERCSPDYAERFDPSRRKVAR